MSYNSGVIVLVISNHLSDYSLNNCTPLSPITITKQINKLMNKKDKVDSFSSVAKKCVC